MATFSHYAYQGVHNMATHILVDTANTFFRARHVVRGDLDTKVGMALHITLSGVKKAWQDFDADHVVFCLEGRSWRKDFYEPYKRNRQVARDKMTVTESEEDKVFWEIFDEFKDFVTTKTNCTVMRHGYKHTLMIIMLLLVLTVTLHNLLHLTVNNTMAYKTLL